MDKVGQCTVSEINNFCDVIGSNRDLSVVTSLDQAATVSMLVPAAVLKSDNL